MTVSHQSWLIAAHRKIGTTALAACFASGCCAGPRINRFDANPQVLCQGETAVIRWDATGDLAMAVQAEPVPSAEDYCAAAGRDTLVFTLVAHKNGEDAEHKVEVAQLHKTAAEPVVLSTNAIEGNDVVASGEKNIALWGDRVEVATVAACGRRRIQVQHVGKTAALPADGTPSDALANTALRGPWELRSPLSPEEQKNPSLRPKELKVLVTVRCREEKSHEAAH